MLRIHECSAGYGDRAVVQGISIEVGEGETGCVIGPSGCGKTTLLKAAAGLLAPIAGSVTLDGEQVNAGDRRVSIIFQSYGLFPWLTAQQNVALGLRLRGTGRRERERIASRELERLGLGGQAHRYPASLSGGQLQRVAIARSMALTPRLLLLDEPFSALDALSREDLQDTLLDTLRAHRLCALMVTHSIEEAVFLGSRIWVLGGAPGRIIGCFENPGQGSRSHRADASYFSLVTAIRETMAASRVGPQAARVG